MGPFHGSQCGNALFFGNVTCLQCGSDRAFLPDRLAAAAIEPASAMPGLWRRPARRAQSLPRLFLVCQNHTEQQALDFAVPQDDPNPLCVCCRLTQILPDLAQSGNHERWYRIEIAKRRLF